VKNKSKFHINYFTICILITFILTAFLSPTRIIPTNTLPVEEQITMYSAESDPVSVPLSKASELHQSGWYNAPVTTMYSADGRSETVYVSEVPMREKDGWYKESIATIIRNGEAKIIPFSESDKYRSDGWSVSEYNLNLSELGTKIKDFVSHKKGRYGIYVKNLATNDVLILNDGQYSSASIIKLFTMATLFDETNKGNLSPDERVRSQLKSMITVSDNQCANNLVSVIGHGDCRTGFETINEFAHSMGCINTQHFSQFEINNRYIAFGKNLASPYDCGILLEKIYNKTLISEEASQQMLELLKNQQLTNKIPNPLPQGTVTANKTGETSRIESDVAIVFSPKCDYIICVLTNDAPSGIEDIRHISKLTYDYFNS